MLQQIESGFVKRERYYVKIREGFMKDLIFTERGNSATAIWFDDPDGPYGYLLHLTEIKIYRYVSDEEFLKKRKQKYDDTCLDIVLKQLVNETFSWS